MEKILTAITYLIAILLLIAFGYSAFEAHKQSREIHVPICIMESPEGGR